ncbi:MAG TPA: type II toxin-antitoxin system VapC family toxin [Planctomycetota bacterium]
MRLLLDTHTLLWLLADDKRLSKAASLAIENPVNDCSVSMASIFEISIKFSVGKLTLGYPFASMCEALASQRVAMLPIAFEHVLRLSTLPLHHRDPFDRMLVAQALEDGYVLVSNNSQLDAYGVKRLW